MREGTTRPRCVAEQLVLSNVLNCARQDNDRVFLRRYEYRAILITQTRCNCCRPRVFSCCVTRDFTYSERANEHLFVRFLLAGESHEISPPLAFDARITKRHACDVRTCSGVEHLAKQNQFLSFARIYSAQEVRCRKYCFFFFIHARICALLNAKFKSARVECESRDGSHAQADGRTGGWRNK